MKILLSIFFSLGLIFININSMYAQEPDGLSCATANPFCSDSAYYFPNFSSADGVTAPTEPDYGCLYSQPNPIWYYMQIDDPGTMLLNITQTSEASGMGIDIDFAMWGPFSDLAEGCEEIMSGTLSPLQCSYSGSSIETVGIGLAGGTGTGSSTPPPAETGDIYIIILTNYSGQAGNISFSQTGGTATTDCSIINCGLTVSNTGPVCENQNFQLLAEESADEGTISFLWTGPGGFTSTMPNPILSMNAAGTYEFTCTSVVVLDDETDTCIATTFVTVNPVYLNNESATICAGEVYEWRGNIYYTSGVYEHTYTSIHGCDSIYNLNLVVNPMPDVTINANQTMICEGEQATIVLNRPENHYTYQWMRNNNLIVGENNTSIVVTEAGEYKVIATTDKGCVDTSARITIVVNPSADVKLNPIDLSGNVCIGDTIKVSVDAKDNYEYRWYPQKFFRYTSDRGQADVYAKLYEPDFIKVVGYNEYGCSAEDSIWVNPVPCCDVYLPTAFSPNNDGKNDYFKMLLRDGQRIVSFQIFDRRGNMVYDNNSTLGWDGRDLNGNVLAQDVYYYRIIYSCTDKQNYEVKGDITLVR